MIPLLLGVIAFIFLALSFLNKKKENILIFQIVAQSFYSVSYLLLNAMSGYAFAIVNLLRSLFVAIKEKFKFLDNNIPLFIFILIYAVLGVYTYQDFYSLFAIVAVIIYSCMIWQGSVKEVRIAGIINAILWFIYDIHFHAYTQAFGDLVIITLTFIKIKRDDKNDQGEIKPTTE